MLHVLKDHDERVTITTHTVKLDDVLVLQVGEELCLPLEILAGCQGGVFQCLKEGAQIYTGWAQVGTKPEQMGHSIAEELTTKGVEKEQLPLVQLYWEGGGRCWRHHLSILFV